MTTQPQRVYLQFNPHEVNRGRKSGYGTWRVVECVNTVIPAVVFRSDNTLAVKTIRPYRRGVIVNPKRLALDYVRSAR